MVHGKSHILVREGVRFTGAGADPHHRLNSSPWHFGDSMLWFLGLFSLQKWSYKNLLRGGHLCLAARSSKKVKF